MSVNVHDRANVHDRDVGDAFLQLNEVTYVERHLLTMFHKKMQSVFL